MTFNPDDLRLMAGLGQQEQKEYMDNLYHKATPMSQETIEALQRSVDDLKPSAFKDEMYKFIKRKKAHEIVMFNFQPETIQLMRRHDKINNEIIAKTKQVQKQKAQARFRQERGVFSKIFSVFSWKFNHQVGKLTQQEEQKGILVDDLQDKKDSILRRHEKSKKNQ